MIPSLEQCEDCFDHPCTCPPKVKPYHEMKLFEKYPLPWDWDSKYPYGENGGNIAAILDKDKKCVATSYYGYEILDMIWDMMCILTKEQEKELGA